MWFGIIAGKVLTVVNAVSRWDNSYTIPILKLYTEAEWGGYSRRTYESYGLRNYTLSISGF